MRPWLLRPPVRFAGSSRLFSGVFFVTSSKADTLRKRRPGLVGLYLRNAISDHSPSEPRPAAAKSARRKDAGSVRSRRLRIRPRTKRRAALQRPAGPGHRGEGSQTLDSSSFEDFDSVTRAKLHDGLLPAGLRALVVAAALRLRLHLDDVHALDLDVEELFHRLADLRLVRLGVDAERILVVLDQAVALLGDHRGDEDLARIEAHWRSPSESDTVSESERRASQGRRERSQPE